MSSEELEVSHKTLSVSELVDLAYVIAKEQFGNKPFAFTALWSKVWRDAENFSKEKVEDWIGYFYTELSNDSRFTLYSFKHWKLREFVPIKEVQMLEKYVFSGETVFEEESKVYEDSLKSSKKEVEIILTEESSADDNIDDIEEALGEKAEDLDSEEVDEIFESEEE